MNIELKPCPFCGGRVVIRKTIMMQKCYSITCQGCGADVFFYEKEHDQKLMAEAWNRRAEG